MKKFLILLCLFGLFFIPPIASAEEVVEVRTFAWEQADLTNVDLWEMHWGDAAGGPYTELGRVPYDGTSEGPTFQAPISATIEGPGGTTVTKYFILRACGDVPQEDGSTQYQCSENSEEISDDFWIPAGAFQVPVQFRIIPTP